MTTHGGMVTGIANAAAAASAAAAAPECAAATALGVGWAYTPALLPSPP